QLPNEPWLRKTIPGSRSQRPGSAAGRSKESMSCVIDSSEEVPEEGIGKGQQQGHGHEPPKPAHPARLEPVLSRLPGPELLLHERVVVEVLVRKTKPLGLRSL